MTNIKPKVLVLGVSGKVGRGTYDLLKSDSSLEVVAAARSLEKLIDIKNQIVHLDLDKPETIGPALAGIDRVFLVTAYTVDMMRQSKDFLNAAKRAGVKHVVHLGACGDDDTRVAHYAWHQFVERYIEWCGFSFTHLRPEIFMQNLLGYGGMTFVDKGVIRHFVGETKLSWVDCDDVSAVAAKALSEPEKYNGQTLRLGYEAASFHQIAQIFSKTLGQTFRYEARPPEEFLQAVLEAGAEPAYMQCVYNSYSDMTAGVDLRAGEVFDNFQSIVNRAPKTLSDFALANSAQFKH